MCCESVGAEVVWRGRNLELFLVLAAAGDRAQKIKNYPATNRATALGAPSHRVPSS